MSEDKEELDIQETRRILGPNSYNDNWDLVNYTSEMRDSKGKFFAFIDFTSDGIGTVRECEHCLTFEIHSKLGPKILKKGEKPAPDHDQFMQCHSCGEIYPIYQTYPESEIRDSLETVTNPFEEQTSIFLSVGKRKLIDRHNKYQDEDPDIAEEIRKHGSDNVRII